MSAHAKITVDPVRGSEALARLLEYPDVNTVLDIGSGAGEHAAIMRAAGKTVTTISLEEPADIVGDFLATDLPTEFDAIWASHVLEHQPNVNLFLARCFSLLRDDGVLAVTVPPHKPSVVGGHLTTWNSGILLYNLIVAGFDCSEARISDCYRSGPGYPPYNISAIVRKRRAALPPLRCDSGDVLRLAEFFPCEVAEGFDGRMPAIDW